MCFQEAQKILKSLSSSVSLKAIKKEPTVNDLQEIPVTSDVDPGMDFDGKCFVYLFNFGNNFIPIILL